LLTPLKLSENNNSDNEKEDGTSNKTDNEEMEE